MPQTFYSPNLVQCQFTPTGDAFPALGFNGRAEGDFVDAAFTTPDRFTTTARFGITTHSYSSDESGEITITLQAASVEAKILRQIMAANEVAARTTGVIVTGELVVRNPNNGQEIVTLSDCVCANAPNVTFGEAAPNRAFVFRGRIAMTAEVTG